MNDFHNSTYLGVFLDEMDEQLQCLDESLLVLENDGSKNDTIQTIFRAAHTLKGSSAVMGFEKLNKLTHQMESVFDLIRNGQLEVTSDLLNILFDCIDYIKQLRQSFLAGNMAEGETSTLLIRLDEIRSQAVGTTAEINAGIEKKETSALHVIFDEAQKEQIQQALCGGSEVMAIYIHLSQEESMKFVRAKLIEINLMEQGEVVVCYPELKLLETDTEFSGTLVYILITKENRDAIISSLNQISQIHSVHIESITKQNLHTFVAGKEVQVVEASTKDQTIVKEISISESKVQVTQTVRVDVERLESLLNLVGELIIDRTRLSSTCTKLNEQFRNNPEVMLLNDIANHLGAVVTDLQEGMMKTRMLPIEHLFGRFPRMVRDLAHKSNKEIELIVEGRETELDRTLIEEISDPLIHILRNSADHGIELPEERIQMGKPRKGTIVLRASHQGNMIVITVADDGRGIDVDKVKAMAIRKGFVTEEEAAAMTEKELIFLIFRSGVSTANQVTDLSGRGVGMDIVKSHIEKLNGVMDIETTKNEGTVFTIKVPLTLAIIRSLLVKFGTSTYAIPLVNVIEIFRIKNNDIRLVQGREVCMFRGQVLPLVRLHKKLGIQEGEGHGNEHLFVVIVGLADKRICLVVNQTIGNQEIVIKSLGNYIGSVPYIAGSTILGDGHVAHILDIGSVVREAGTYDKKVLDYTEVSQLDSRNEKYVTFGLAGIDFGIPISKMKEIVPVPEIHPLVSAPVHVLGMINLREILLPVYDLRFRLGIDVIDRSSDSRIMICEVSGHEVGLIVDKVSKVSRLSQADLEEAPDHVLRNSDYLEAIYKKDNEFIHLLNLEKLLNLEQTKKKEAG
ncbi:chemotaxis protein CheW [Paenibacillus sp. sgz500958]|uniref:chemotaxis protein CheW n=1 Tax=Paenibacillus sp. sgz500958 TaxID=3242475 RepID=UPI0036D2F94A